MLFTNNIKTEVSITTIKHNNIEYTSIDEFIIKHQLKSTYYESKEKLEIIFEDKKIYFSPFSSYCKIDDKTYHLTYQTILKNNRLHIPVLPVYYLLEKVNLLMNDTELNNKIKVKAKFFYTNFIKKQNEEFLKLVNIYKN